MTSTKPRSILLENNEFLHTKKKLSKSLKRYFFHASNESCNGCSEAMQRDAPLTA
jgi:hypothetical protein